MILGLTTYWSNLQRTFALLILLITIMLITKITLFLIAFQKHWLVTLSVSIYHIIKSVFKTVLVFFTIHLHRRFKEINRAINGMVVSNISASTNTPLTLDRLCKLHFRLCHLSKKLNDIAAFPFLYYFSLSLSALLFFSYITYHNLKTINLAQSGKKFL